MKFHTRILRLIYRWLIRCYPAQFRAAFGEEMLVVFDESLNHGTADRLFVQAAFLGRELRDLPASVLQAYWYEKKGSKIMSSQIQENPVSRWALIGVTAFFIFAGTFEMIQMPGSITDNPVLRAILPFIFLSIVFGPLVVGIFNRLPRWSMVFGGLFLGIVGIYGVFMFIDRKFEPQIFGWMNRILSPHTLQSRLLWQWINQGRLWFAILITFFASAGLIALIPRFRSFTKRLWLDWTLASFMFFGASLMLFFIDFDEFQHDDWYRLGCMLAMAAGAWGYLKARDPLNRTAALLAGITVCMAIMGVGKYFLVPQQDWPVWFARHPVESERWFESLRTFGTWFWMALFIGLPGLLQHRRAGKRMETVLAEAGV